MFFGDIPTLSEWKRQSYSFNFSFRSSKPAVVRIDDLIERYHKVTYNAKINILFEIRNAVADWMGDKIDRDVSTGRLPAMRALEEVVLRKLSAMVGWEGRKYQSAVCIGYQVAIDTYPSAQPFNRAHAEQVDLRQRLDCMIAAIQQTYREYSRQALDAGRDSDTEAPILKIFMAPEFYFRPRTGAYEGMWPIPEIFQKVRMEIRKEKYKNWLFVLGSAVVGVRLEENRVDQGLVLDNYALIQEGGPDAGEDRYVQKEFTSHIDFIHNSPDLFYDVDRPGTNVYGQDEELNFPQGSRPERDNPLVAPPLLAQRVSELAGGAIFTVHGIRFGLEVCRDHYMNRLAVSREKGTIQIHLIPAGGMGIEVPSIATMAGGIVFNVDSAPPDGDVVLGISDDPDNQAAHFENPVHSFRVPGCQKIPAGWIHIYEPYPIPYRHARPDVARRLGVPVTKL